jgi:hypothetical protein
MTSSQEVTLPFDGVPYVTADIQESLRCAHCREYKNEPSLFVLETFQKPTDGETTFFEVPYGPTLINRAAMHLLHLNCFSDYNVERELDLLQHITLPKRDKTDNADIPDLLLTADDYLRDIVMEYASVVEDFTVQCNATVTQRSNPSYRLYVPLHPPTPVAGRRLWNEKFVQQLFAVVHYVDVEVVKRNNLDSTNFETFTNQIKKIFKDIKLTAGT